MTVHLKAIILAAGEGKRLKPLTDDLPKCMVNLFGKSLLERQLETFRDCGINDISIITGYKQHKINFIGVRYFRNPKYNTTNMVETLFCAKEVMKEGIIVSYGDIIFQKNVLDKLIAEKEDLAVVIDEEWYRYWKIRFTNPLDDAESLQIDKDGYITNIGQKVKNINEIMGQYIGLMKFQKEGLDSMVKFYDKSKMQAKNGVNPLNTRLPFEKSFMTDFLQGLIKKGYKIKAVPIKNCWLELDTLKDYRIYEEMYTNQTLKSFFSI